MNILGVTAENVAEKFQIPRSEQDKFALKSQEKTLKAQKRLSLMKILILKSIQKKI